MRWFQRRFGRDWIQDSILRVPIYSPNSFRLRPGAESQERMSRGNPVRIVLDPSDAARWLRQFAAKLTSIELSVSEVLDALDRAGERGVRGGRVHDYLHAAAAEKIRADVLITHNTDDFAGLLSTTRLEWP